MEGEAKMEREIAQRMLRDSMPIEMIIKYSGLTIAAIQDLQAQMA
jgi:hypothetical protein